jgi:hypothetical protein
MSDQSFLSIDLSAEAAPGICRDCLRSAMLYEPAAVAWVRCKHTNHCARLDSDGWHSEDEMDHRAFRERILAAVVKFELMTMFAEADAHNEAQH